MLESLGVQCACWGVMNKIFPSCICECDGQQVMESTRIKAAVFTLELL